MQKNRPFRVYSRGDVVLFSTERDLGRWLHSEGINRGHITVTHRDNEGVVSSSCDFPIGRQGNAWRFMYSPYSEKHAVWHLRFEDDNLRVEAPNGLAMCPVKLVECMRAYENSLKTKRIRYSSRRGYKCNYHRGSTYRLIRTQSERRENGGACIDEDAPPLRPSRANLPTAWDDVYRHKEKNWKSFRAQQWRINHDAPRAALKILGTNTD